MPDAPGLFESLKRAAGTFLAIAHTRLELLSNDLEEARIHVGLMLAYACGVLFCFAAAIILVAVFVITLFWDTHRLQVLAGMSAFFLAAGLLALYALRRLAAGKPRLFAGTLAELSKDRERLVPPQ